MAASIQTLGGDVSAVTCGDPGALAGRDGTHTGQCSDTQRLDGKPRRNFIFFHLLFSYFFF